MTLIAVDIEGYGREERTDPIRVALRARLAGWCAELLAEAGAKVDRGDWQDTGDGWIIAVDPRVPRDVLLLTLATGLHQRLSQFNQDQAAVARLRLRLALHGGDVLRDPPALIGEAVNLTCRLLDADGLRTCLRATSQPLAVIISPAIYDGVVKQGYLGLDRTQWHPLIANTKEGWVRLFCRDWVSWEVGGLAVVGDDDRLLGVRGGS